MPPSGRAFLWEDERLRELGTLGGAPSVAVAINGRGQVVGSSTLADGRERAFLWEGSLMLDLNSLLPSDSGWTLLVASGINDRGQIVGKGLRDGQSRAFLLTP